MGDGEIGPDRDGFPEARERGIDVLAGPLHVAEIDAGLDVRGLAAQRGAVARDRLVEPALRLQDVAEVAVRPGVVGLEGDGLAQARDRGVAAAKGVQQQPEVVVRLGELRPQREPALQAFNGAFEVALRPRGLRLREMRLRGVGADRTRALDSHRRCNGNRGRARAEPVAAALRLLSAAARAGVVAADARHRRLSR